MSPISTPPRPVAILLTGVLSIIVVVQIWMATTQLIGHRYASFGRAVQQAGDVDSARFLFERSTRWHSRNWESHYAQAGLLQQLGDLDSAGLAFEKSLALAPHETLVLTNYARLLASRGDLDRAIEMNNDALDIAPGNWRAHEVAGFIATERGDYVLAVREFEQALDLAVTPDPRIMNQLANVLYQLKDYERALEYAEMAVKKQGLQANHHLVKGKALLALDRPKEAARSLTRAERGYSRRVQRDATKQPVLVESLRYLAVAQIDAGQLSNGANTLEKLVQLVGSTSYMNALLDDFSTALVGTLHSLNATTQYRFGRALIGASRYEEAAQALALAFPKLEGEVRLDCGALYAYALIATGRPDGSLAGLRGLTSAERAEIESLLEAYSAQ